MAGPQDISTEKERFDGFIKALNDNNIDFNYSKYGSYVFLGEIITNAPIECNEVRSIQEYLKAKMMRVISIICIMI